MIVCNHVSYPFCLLICHSRFGVGEDKMVMDNGIEIITGPPMFVTPTGKRHYDLPGIYHFTDRGENLAERIVYISPAEPRKVGWFDEFGYYIELRFWHFKLPPPK